MSDSKKTFLLVASEPELVSWLLNDIGADSTDEPATATFSDSEIRFASSTEAGVASPDLPADTLVGLVRFVDVLSLQNMAELLQAAPGAQTTPLALLVYRNENEADFKMSCPYCGQKLWVRDADVDKRGRCPHCRKGFTLPRQEDQVRTSLKLPSDVPVLRVVRNETGSLSGPFRQILSLKGASVLDNLGMNTQAANQTMNVDVEETDEG